MDSLKRQPSSWEAALWEAEDELRRARTLVEALETLTRYLRERMRAGEPWPGSCAGME